MVVKYKIRLTLIQKQILVKFQFRECNSQGKIDLSLGELLKSVGNLYSLQKTVCGTISYIQ